MKQNNLKFETAKKFSSCYFNNLWTLIIRIFSNFDVCDYSNDKFAFTNRIMSIY